MNIVFVDGGTKQLREIAHKTVAFCIDEMLPDSNKIQIEVKLTNIKTEATGYTLMGDNRRQYELEIDKNQKLREFVSTICHEMVHVKQYFLKEMDDHMQDDGNYRWKEEVVPVDTLYSELPWEVEAFDLQYVLADKIWEQNVI